MQTTLTCPSCDYTQTEVIPENSCKPFYICDNCEKTIQAKEKDCCVFCSYGEKDCPISHKKS